MSKFFCHVISKRVRPQLVWSMLRGLNENSLINKTLLKRLHTSRPTLGYAKNFKQLKEYSKNYWYILAPIYVTNNVIWYLVCQYAIQQGFDVIKLLRQLNVNDDVVEFLTSHFMGKHALTILLFKLLMPLRFLTVFQSSKAIIQYIAKNDLLPPKPINIWKKTKK